MRWWICAGPISFRFRRRVQSQSLNTWPLCSAWRAVVSPLSTVWLVRNLVKSPTRGFSRNGATRWLMNSDPLSQ